MSLLQNESFMKQNAGGYAHVQWLKAAIFALEAESVAEDLFELV